MAVLTTTDRVKAYLKANSGTRHEMAVALNLNPSQVTYAIQGMQARAQLTTVGRLPIGKGRSVAIYALAELLPPVTPQSIVALALANEPELARVWR